MNFFDEADIKAAKELLRLKREEGLRKTLDEISEFTGLNKTYLYNLGKYGTVQKPKELRNNVVNIRESAKAKAKASVKSVPSRGNRFPPDFKKKVAYEYEHGHLTIDEIAEKYGVGRSSVYRWSR